MNTDYELTILWGEDPSQLRELLGFTANDLEVSTGNVDVEVALADGSRWGATFFTLSNIEALFEKNRRTGECHGGLYFWATGMIIVRQLDQETIEATIEALRDDGEFEQVFNRLG
jgi:hypothetical protein